MTEDAGISRSGGVWNGRGSILRVAAVLLGLVVGAGIGFAAGLIGMWLMVHDSGAAIAGGGDGVDALIAACLCSGVVVAVAGALAGGWVGHRLTVGASHGSAKPLYGLESHEKKSS